MGKWNVKFKMKDNVPNNQHSDFILSMIAMVCSFLVAGIFILLVGQSPVAAYIALFQGAFGSVSSIANTLCKSVPLMFTGIAVAFAMKGGLLNVGAEGQLYIGALASVVLALKLPNLPGFILLPVSILFGCLGGMVWGGIAGFLKAKRGVNEVIVTLMMNYIAILFTSYLVNGPFKAEGMVPQTEVVPTGAAFPKLIPRTQLTVTLFLAILVVILVYLFLQKTSWGYEIRAVGENSSAAEAGGIHITKTTILTMAISGGIAALAGISESLGTYGRFIDNFSPSFGFTGIAIAVLGKGNPFGTIITAILFGAMDAGSMRMNRVAGISASMVNVIQGLVILFIAAPQIYRILLAGRRKS
ncbi:MAG: inner-rane translocator [Anaerocolumna sp.]|jgi:simple sugar transport system permease protein|nr:inner-rane translocator [Anaerocolumna sp.]